MGSNAGPSRPPHFFVVVTGAKPSPQGALPRPGQRRGCRAFAWRPDAAGRPDWKGYQGPAGLRHAPMARLVPAALALLALAIALSGWAPRVAAGSAEAPEVVDAADDHAVLGLVPLEGVGQFVNADVLAAWIEEAGADLTFVVQVQGSGDPTTTTNYEYDVTFEVGGTAATASCSLGAASPVGSGAAAPGGVATACVTGGSQVLLTVPKDAIGASAGSTITGIFVETTGTPVTNPLTVVEDRAPDDGAGADYVVGAGGAAGNGTAGDSDGDGLNDTKEVDYFGNVTAHNGTADPDADGLNNTAEFDGGTDPTKADTDADGLDDKADPFPLDPRRPNTSDPGGNTTDSDRDGLPDGYERETFGSLDQTGSGDPDGDGLNTTEERELGTDPLEADTDGDGAQDADDAYPTDPARSKAPSKSGLEPEVYAGAPLFAAIATLCLIALARIS